MGGFLAKRQLVHGQVLARLDATSAGDLPGGAKKNVSDLFPKSIDIGAAEPSFRQPGAN
jgi:hypothetical protein